MTTESRAPSATGTTRALTQPDSTPTSAGGATSPWSPAPHHHDCRCADCEHAYWADVDAHDAYVSGIEAA